MRGLLFTADSLLYSMLSEAWRHGNSAMSKPLGENTVDIFIEKSIQCLSTMIFPDSFKMLEEVENAAYAVRS